jgi:hypothetical protein
MSRSCDVEHDSLAVQFVELIVRPLKPTGLSTAIIIDALDECKDKGQFRPNT